MTSSDYCNKKTAVNSGWRCHQVSAALDDTVVLAGGRYARYSQHSISQEEILGPIPPAPAFAETMEDIRRRLDATLPKVPVPRDSGLWHPAAAKLLKRDDEKRERQKTLSYVSTWDAPLYDAPIQRRRLRLLSAIFLTLARQGCRADTWGGHPYEGPLNEFTITVGHQSVRLRASVIKTKTTARGGHPASTSAARLRLALDPGEDKRPDGQFWEDGKNTLEQQARGIVLAIMLNGEQQHRDAAISSHTWRIELKARTIEHLERERAEAERKERERQAALERKRVDDLLGDAVAFRRARDIRA